MKKILLATALCMTSLSAVAADAQNDYYFQVNAGYVAGMKSKAPFGKTGKTGSFGIEAGAQINENFRASLSLDYMPSFSVKVNNQNLTSSSASINANSPAGTSVMVAPGVNVTPIDPTKLTTFAASPYTLSSTNVKVKSFVTMLNLYYDIGNFNGFTPYATAGLGIARNKAKASTTTTALTTSTTASVNAELNGVEAPAVSTAAPLASFSATGKTNTNFAWKLGLGTRYDINSSVAVDVRYQFVSLGKFKTAASNGIPAQSGKLRANEVLVGVAYKF